MKKLFLGVVLIYMGFMQNALAGEVNYNEMCYNNFKEPGTEKHRLNNNSEYEDYLLLKSVRAKEKQIYSKELNKTFKSIIKDYKRKDYSTVVFNFLIYNQDMRPVCGDDTAAKYLINIQNKLLSI